jgi:asparagine synthase (glutamine-hydrolysing)
MCGILAALGVTGDSELNRRDILKLSKLLRHRGPDATGVYEAPDGRAFIAFERLSIVDPSSSGKYVAHFVYFE